MATIQSEIIEPVERFMGTDYQDIYKAGNGPPDHWPLEWKFILKVPGEQLPSGVKTDEPYWILHDKHSQNGVNEWKEKIEEKSVLRCSPGTQWEKIKIVLVANDTVRVETPERKDRFTYHKLGMADGRSGDSPTMLWELLKLFAKNKGFISSQNTDYNRKLPDTAKRLNAHLQKLFGINDSIYMGHYKKERGYRTKIRFSDQTCH